MPKKTLKSHGENRAHHIFNDCRPPKKALRICVVLPAKNEAENIVITLQALKDQKKVDGSALEADRYEVLLLANNCTDETYSLALGFAKQHPGFNLHVVQVTLDSVHANIGYVRRLLMDEAYRRLAGSRGQGIIASTDSDTIVDARWLNNMMYEISLGCDAVGGRIMADTRLHEARTFYRRDDTYRLLKARLASVIDPDDSNPWPCHYQYFGASLALTCNMYRKCGRMPVVPYLEDMALHNQLLKVDARIRCSPLVKVYTSSRVDGRVEIGFSEQLLTWTNHKKNRVTQVVEPVPALLIKLQCKNILRKCFTTYCKTGVIPAARLQAIAGHLSIAYEWLEKEFGKSKYFGGLWLQVEGLIASGSFYGKFPPSPITRAISELKALLKTA